VPGHYLLASVYYIFSATGSIPIEQRFLFHGAINNWIDMTWTLKEDRFNTLSEEEFALEHEAKKSM